MAKDEIKEILDKLNNGFWEKDEEEIAYKILFSNEVYKLLDYITNLQEENERLKEENNRLINEPITMKMGRIDSVVANIYRNHRKQVDYKSRTEKAIEILNNIYLLDNVSITNNAVEEIDKAINILQGVGKDE